MVAFRESGSYMKFLYRSMCFQWYYDRGSIRGPRIKQRYKMSRGLLLCLFQIQHVVAESAPISAVYYSSY